MFDHILRSGTFENKYEKKREMNEQEFHYFSSNFLFY